MEIPCEQSAVQLIIAIAAHRTAPLFRASYLNLCRGKVAGVSRLTDQVGPTPQSAALTTSAIIALVTNLDPVAFALKLWPAELTSS